MNTRIAERKTATLINFSAYNVGKVEKKAVR